MYQPDQNGCSVNLRNIEGYWLILFFTNRKESEAETK